MRSDVTDRRPQICQLGKQEENEAGEEEAL